jgi:2-polyprenyl-6-methoxyphenol hydroxylase-like FAD-dependent oxidoreductase
VKNKNVLISGASIAGPALAYWLRRYGFTPTVVERAPGRRDGGYKIDLRGAAVDVAERMGILAEVRRSSTGMRGASYVNGAGKRVARVSAELFGGRERDDVEVMRGDLGRILAAATPGTEYLFGDAITAIDQDDQGVLVSFQHGRPRAFDLVVGADGLHSGVRALAFARSPGSSATSATTSRSSPSPTTCTSTGRRCSTPPPAGLPTSTAPGRTAGPRRCSCSLRRRCGTTTATPTGRSSC